MRIAGETLTLPVPIDLGGLRRDGLRGARVARLPRLTQQVGDELVATVHELLARPAVVFRADGVLAEERERDGRIAVGDDRVRQHARD